MKSKLAILSVVLSMVLTCFTGCITAHVKYSLNDVKPIPVSRYSRSSLFIEDFKDTRYKDKKSVSTYVKKHGSYTTYDAGEGIGIRPKPQMSDYGEIFKGVQYSADNSYYCAPDRLYWVPTGPLADAREMLAKHIESTHLFSSVTTKNSIRSDYTLRINVRRFLSLKERRPVVDVLDICFTGYLFSSDEIISGLVDWELVNNASGKIEKSGTASYGSVENHHVFRSSKKPFELNNKLAKHLSQRIISQIAAFQ